MAVNQHVKKSSSITYPDALVILEECARSKEVQYLQDEESVDLFNAVGRINKHALVCPFATPAYDTSAMDGYAVNSRHLQGASLTHPVTLCVRGVMIAGAAPILFNDAPEVGIHSCIEITTGAQFPEASSGTPYDACVRLEDIRHVSGPSSSQQYIQILKPVRQNQNRRFAGEDFQCGDCIVPALSVIRSSHIMGLAAFGMDSITVLRRLRIAVWSTGLELQQQDITELPNHKIRDVNGPYISTVLQEWGAEVDFCGVVPDDAAGFANTLSSRLATTAYDIIITTGAVSRGRMDFVREGLELGGASVHFHNLAIRPGHPTLFATVPSHEWQASFFGLPGNPIASAACLRFLVMPYIRCISRQSPEVPLAARLAQYEPAATLATSFEGNSSYTPSLPNLHCFRYGSIRQTKFGLEVSVEEKQSSSRIKPFSGTNCWVMLPPKCDDTQMKNTVDCYEMRPGSWIT